MLTKGAIGNLINRYRAVLKKCNLMNTFGSLAVASMLVMGGAGVAGAAELTITHENGTYTATGAGVNISDSSVSTSMYEAISQVSLAGSMKSYDTYKDNSGELTSNSPNATDENGNRSGGDWLAGPYKVLGKSGKENFVGNKLTLTNGDYDSSYRMFACNTYEAGRESNASANKNVLTVTNVNATAVSNNIPAAPFIGGWGWNDANENIITFTNSKTSHFVYGGDAQFGDSKYNEVTIEGSVVGYVNGGTARYDGYDAMGNGKGNTIGNTVTIINSEVYNSIVGGQAGGCGDSIGNTVTVDGLIFTNTKKGGGGALEGGYAEFGNAKNNKVIVKGASEITGLIFGGRAQEQGNAIGNEVIIQSGEISYTQNSSYYGIYGGVAENRTDSSTCIVEQNSVKITGGTITSNIYGGVAGNSGVNTTPPSKSGSANQNSVEITGGTITGNIYGGYAKDAANNNTVTIDGVTVTGDVYGGYSTAGTATGNVVNLLNGAKVTETVSIGDNGTLTISGETSAKTLEGSGTIVVDSAGSAIDVTTNSGSFTAKGSAKLNDQTGGDLAQVKNAVSGLNLADENITGMDEGLISGAVSADGTKQANTVMQDTLDIATTAPLAVGRIVMNDVRKRMGDLRDATGEAGAWMRWDGGKLKGDEGLTNNFNTIQIGADMLTGIKNVRAGVAAAFTHGDLDHNNGDGEMETYSFSAYGVWMADNGMFADVIARVGFTNTELNVKGRSVDLDNEVFSLSGEYGWRLPVCSQFYVEPQIELTYTYVTGADSKLDYATYEVDALDSLLGRAGMAFGWKLPNDRGNLYARASVVHEFLGDAKITGSALGNTEVHELDGDDTWLEYGIGANVKLTDNTYIWADVERTEGAEIDEEWRGTVGVRFSF